MQANNIHCVFESIFIIFGNSIQDTKQRNGYPQCFSALIIITNIHIMIKNEAHFISNR